jgi:hypothetical protein
LSPSLFSRWKRSILGVWIVRRLSSPPIWWQTDNLQPRFSSLSSELYAGVERMQIAELRPDSTCKLWLLLRSEILKRNNFKAT